MGGPPLLRCVDTKYVELHRVEPRVDGRDFLSSDGNACRTKVLAQTLQLAASWNGNDMRVLVDHPRKRELAHGAALLLGHSMQQVEQVLGFGVAFLGVLWHALAEVLLAFDLVCGV